MSFWNDLDNFNYHLSNYNAVASSAVSAAEDLQNKKSPEYTIFNFGANVSNGLARNDVAKFMADHGDSDGQALNALNGYGNFQSNAKGTYDLTMANVGNPWFGRMMGFSMPNFGMFGGGMYYPQSISSQRYFFG